jgi:hypothetical protein
MSRTSLIAATLLASACEGYAHCDPQPAQALAQLPEQLSETGLYSSPEMLAEDVLTYTPRFELWSDGADKRRFVRIPPGQRIDTSNQDDWQFPVGTQLWKEFTRDGVRVETRLLQKLGPNPADWAALAYVWNEDGSDAIAAVRGAQDVLGSEHDVPSAEQCFACHAGRNSRVLGLSLVQLAYTVQADQQSVQTLQERALLSDTLPERLDLPGDATASAALGYLHANCGTCHNSARPAHSGARCFDPQNELDFWLRADALGSVDATPTLRSSEPPELVPGFPALSMVVQLMSRRGDAQHMPPLASEQVDRRAVALVRDFIGAL